MPAPTAISFGGGVQTTALAILTVQGRIPTPAHVAVFADTEGVHPETYEYMRQLEAWLGDRLPIVRVSAGSLYDRSIEKRTIPTRHFRSCTDKFKIRPLRRWMKANGATRSTPGIFQIGISTDELRRARPSNVQYVVNQYPLIELGISRSDCLDKAEGLLAPPKSGCYYCPFASPDRRCARGRQRSYNPLR